MDKISENLIIDTIKELKLRKSITPIDDTYDAIINQIEFVYSCFLQNKNITQELGNRRLNFGAMASKNLTSPDEETLLNNIGKINIMVIEK